MESSENVSEIANISKIGYGKSVKRCKNFSNRRILNLESLVTVPYIVFELSKIFHASGKNNPPPGKIGLIKYEG